MSGGKSASLPAKRRWLRVLKRVLAATFVILLGLELAVRRTDLPAALLLPTQATPVVLDFEGRMIVELGNPETRSCRPLPLDKISPWMITATLAAEDHRFYSHSGIDWTALGGAAARNLTAGRVVSGASTLTQQLIKLESGNIRRSLPVKLQENLAALRLEREWTKSAILERYLNRVEYGNRLRGVEAAARAYFGKPALELTLAEAVYLSGIPQSPTRFNPRTHPDRAEQRYRQVCRKIQRLGVITAAQIASLEAVPTLRPVDTATPAAPHFIAKLRQREQAPEGEVRTTLNLDLQRQVEAILARHLRRLAPSGAGNAAAVVIDHRDGSVRAWCGSGDWSSRNGQVDGVTLPRSCGSTLKPFLYLHALDRRIMTAASLLPDTPDAIRGEYVDYDPRNYDDRFWGPVRLREALANSLNVPAVFTLAKVGARDTYDYLRRSGIPLARSIDEYGAGLILGNAEVRMLDLASAYGAFAHQGVAARPRFLQNDPRRDLAISSPEAAAIIADILSDNDARRKTFGPFSPLSFDGIRVACKTGTSSGFRDAWTFGVTGLARGGGVAGEFLRRSDAGGRVGDRPRSGLAGNRQFADRTGWRTAGTRCLACFGNRADLPANRIQAGTIRSRARQRTLHPRHRSAAGCVPVFFPTEWRQPGLPAVRIRRLVPQQSQLSRRRGAVRRSSGDHHPASKCPVSH